MFNPKLFPKKVLVLLLALACVPCACAKKNPDVTFTIPGSSHFVTFTPDGTQLLCESGLFDAQTGAKLKDWPFEYQFTVYSVAFSPDGTQVLANTITGVYLWDVRTGEKLRSFLGAHMASLSPDGKKVLTVSVGGLVQFWDLEKPEQKPQELCRLKVDGSKHPLSVELSPDGAHILTIGTDACCEIGGIAQLWDVQTGELVRTLGQCCWTVIFSPDGRTVLSSCGPLWDAETGQVLQTFDFGGFFISNVAFSPDGTRIAAVSCYDPNIKVWTL